MLPLGCDTSLLLFPRVYPEDTEEAVRQCELLLAEQDFDNAIRYGDILGFLVQHYTQVKKFHTVSEVLILLTYKTHIVHLCSLVECGSHAGRCSMVGA